MSAFYQLLSSFSPHRNLLSIRAVFYIVLPAFLPLLARNKALPVLENFAPGLFHSILGAYACLQVQERRYTPGICAFYQSLSLLSHAVLYYPGPDGLYRHAQYSCCTLDSVHERFAPSLI